MYEVLGEPSEEQKRTYYAYLNRLGEEMRHRNMLPLCHYEETLCEFKKGSRCGGIQEHHEIWGGNYSPLELLARSLKVYRHNIPACRHFAILHAGQTPKRPPAIEMALEVGMSEFPEDTEQRMARMVELLTAHQEYKREHETQSSPRIFE